MTIPKITPYSGGVANPDGSQTQTEFTQNMFDQLSYEAELSTELNNTVDGINDTAIQVDADATSAAQSAASAEAAVSGLNYQGLWPDTGGSADKGDTYQTQVSSTPTGQYFTALQDTTVDPVGDDVNWRAVVSDQSIGSVTSYQASSISNMINGDALNSSVNLVSNQVWSVNGVDYSCNTNSTPAPDGIGSFTNLSKEGNPSLIESPTSLLNNAQTTVCLIGDSITTGQGASSPEKGYSNLLSQCIYEQFDNGTLSEVRSLGYGVVSNMREFINTSGVSGDGTSIIGYNTPSNEMYRLLHNQYIEVTGRQADYYDVFYDRTIGPSSMVDGVVEMYVNDALVASKSVTLAGTEDIGTTYPTGLKSSFGRGIEPSDTVKLKYVSDTAQAGDPLYVVGVSTIRKNENLGSHVVKFNYPGWTFDNFLPLTDKINEMVATVRYDSDTPQLFVIALGTNSIYNAGTAQTVSEYIDSLDGLIASIGATLNRRFAVWIPYEADTPELLGEYYEYVSAIREYCRINDVTCIDLSNSDINGNSTWLDDSLHPNDNGHALLACEVCKKLGIPFNPIDQAKPVSNVIDAQDIVPTSPWSALSLTGNELKARELGGAIFLSGLIAPNGATNGVCATLPGGYQPEKRAIYTSCTTPSGTVSLTISAGGSITLGSFNESWYSFDGVSFPKIAND